ncbi:NAD-dependent epimerase/dehydratase family protein [Francisella sp. SYW-2]|uniref:NAD-dependent epimerase/dehydratase family protein n=1 Tax=Francisella sp. SYW-2 TaxID=2610886 RepID=UPI00123D7CB3|nr:NAD-dependent epimerase/dehydratase family protein [Francisella sp. SYW-2]
MQINTALIGFTGFVGSNLMDQYNFNAVYNSKNIQDIEGENINILICAGVSAVKWMANQNPEFDNKNILKLQNHLKKTKIKHLVLISTVDIYDTPINVNEDSTPNTSKQDAYGKNRYALENWARSQTNILKCTVVRLPALFGKGLKKNLIFDIMNPLAKSINKDLWSSLKSNLSTKDLSYVSEHYTEDITGNIVQNDDIKKSDKDRLISIFANIGFSTLKFTDSRSKFQFYNLDNLWNDINKYALEDGLDVINLTSEPVSASEVVEYTTGNETSNRTSNNPVNYDMHSKHAKDNKYLYSKDSILSQIKDFICRNKS